jgi:hypothetical protein
MSAFGGKADIAHADQARIAANITKLPELFRLGWRGLALLSCLIELCLRTHVCAERVTTLIAPAHVTFELFIIGVVATFLTAATVWVLWYVFETIFPDDVKHLGFFLIFIIVLVPFVMLIYFGLDAVIDDEVATRAGLPTELPLGLPPEIPVLAVVYIGLTVCLGLPWRKLKSVKEG